MNYSKATLKESIKDIFKIGKESFEEFYPKEEFLKKLKEKKYWICIAKDKEIVGFKIFYEDNDK